MFRFDYCYSECLLYCSRSWFSITLEINRISKKGKKKIDKFPTDCVVMDYWTVLDPLFLRSKCHALRKFIDLGIIFVAYLWYFVLFLFCASRRKMSAELRRKIVLRIWFQRSNQFHDWYSVLSLYIVALLVVLFQGCDNLYHICYDLLTFIHKGETNV